MHAAFLAVALVASGCFTWTSGDPVDGSGDRATRTVDVDGVRSVRLALPGELVVERGAAPLVIEGDDNLVGRVEAEVEDGALAVRAPEGVRLRPDRPFRFRVGVDRLEGLAIAGSGGARASDVAADVLEVSIAGSGDVTLDGRVGRLAVRIAGSGDVDAADLAADEAEVRISGSGDVELRAEKTLDVRISGSGDVRYHGSAEVSRRVSGSGDVERAGG